MNDIRLESKYNFFDTLQNASSRKKTVREMILMQEKAIEDPRVPEEFGVESAEKRSQALFADSMRSLLGDNSGLFKDNAPIGAFPTNALERLDMNVRKQALRTYATRDIPFQYGGGAIESIKGFKEQYQLPKGGFIGGDTNQVRIVNIDFRPIQVAVKPLTYGIRLGFIDSLKNEQLGYDAITRQGEAIKKAWYLDIDRIAYVGTRGEDGTTTDTSGTFRGLLNQENVTTTDLETTTSYTLTTKKIENMGINKAIEVFIGELNAMAVSVDFEAQFMPNKILFYKELFSWLNQTAVNQAGTGTPFRTNKAILQEALDAWCDTQGFDRIEMVMLPYLSNDISDTKDASMVSSGTNETGRIVLYRQDPVVGYLPLPMDLTRGAIVFDINQNAFRQNLLSFVGYLLQFYTETIRYIDNGATETAVTDEMQDLIDDTTIDELSYVYATGVITHKASYPDAIDSSLDGYYQDALIEFADALPATTIVSALTYQGTGLTATDKDLTGRKTVWLSELATEELRNAISGHAGLSNVTMTFTVSGNTTAIDTTMTVKQIVSDDNFATWTVIAEKTSDFETPED